MVTPSNFADSDVSRIWLFIVNDGTYLGLDNYMCMSLVLEAFTNMLLSTAYSAIWSSAIWKAGEVDLSDLEKAAYRVKSSAYLTSLHDWFTFISFM